MSSTVIVVPCYNEAKRLRIDAFVHCIQSEPDIDFVMVDDGSDDDTLRLLDQLRFRFPARVQLVPLPLNSGKAEAVRQGVLAALAIRPDYFGYWDADLATPLDAISQFISVLNRRPEIIQVIGARISLCGRSIHRDSWRCVSGRLFASTASALIGQKIFDTQCGAKLFRTTPLTKTIFNDAFESNWVFDVELMARQINLLGDAKAFRNSVFEFPLEKWDEVHDSKVRPHHFAKSARELILIYVHYLSPIRIQLDRKLLDVPSGLAEDATTTYSSGTQRKAA